MTRSAKSNDKNRSAKSSTRKIEKTNTVRALPSVDPNRRYPVAVALEYLSISNGKFYEQLKAGDICVIKDGGRTFVPGSEIIRKSTLSV